MKKIENIVFDLGNVLIGWDPSALYRPHFNTEAEMKWFFDNVCTDPWNLALDRGGSFDAAIAAKQAEFPQFAEKIGWWKSRWHEMILGEMPGTVALLDRLHAKGLPLFGLTNWSAETFPYARKHFSSLQKFRHIVVSGDVKICKPEPAIYAHAVEAWNIAPESILFIDDSAKNVVGAQAAGWNAVRFTNAAALEQDLFAHGPL
jgi:2-haloacid dehalogenase